MSMLIFVVKGMICAMNPATNVSSYMFAVNEPLSKAI